MSRCRLHTISTHCDKIPKIQKYLILPQRVIVQSGQYLDFFPFFSVCRQFWSSVKIRLLPLYLQLLDLTQRQATTMMMITMEAAAKATMNQISRQKGGSGRRFHVPKYLLEGVVIYGKKHHHYSTPDSFAFFHKSPLFSWTTKIFTLLQLPRKQCQKMPRKKIPKIQLSNSKCNLVRQLSKYYFRPVLIGLLGPLLSFHTYPIKEAQFLKPKTLLLMRLFDVLWRVTHCTFLRRKFFDTRFLTDDASLLFP